jgi:pyruvate/2-oxoacid:ferredoxin oxidoreductase alpha subunit
MTRFAMGNAAVIDAALASGCKLFAGYPVTPSTEILEIASSRFPEEGRTFVPTEGEVTAIHLVAGASLAGYRAMTATTGLGLSSMSEALSFFSGMTELSGVVVVQQRWGPGDGSLGPGQDCYNQATRGCGHGDFHMIVLAPKSVQELADHVQLAFDLADKYGLFVLVMGDQLVAMTSEQYEVPPPSPPIQRETSYGSNTGVILPELVAVDEKAGDFELELVGRKWERKYTMIEATERRHEIIGEVANAKYLLVVYGSLARIAEYALPILATRGIAVAILRPITLWPFPSSAVRDATVGGVRLVVAELSMGQMKDDVERAAGHSIDAFLNWLGGRVPTPEQFADRFEETVTESGVRA